MNGEKSSLNYFFLKLLVIVTHGVLLLTVFLNGNYTDIMEVIKLSVAVIASDLVYFTVAFVIEQNTYTVDCALVLIVNISLIFQSCFGGVNLDLKHFITIIAGMIAYYVGFFFTRNSFKSEKMKPVYYAAIAVLLVVIVIFTGERGIWINLGAMSVQPSEFIKPLLVLVCATSLIKQQEKKKIWIFSVTPNNIYMLGTGIVIIGLQWWCRDLGSIPIFASVIGCAIINRMCYPKAKFSKKKIGVLAGAVALIAVVAIKFAPGYVKDRLYVDIWSNMDSTGYQQCRALIAIAEGGWFGKGPGNGNLYKIAASDTDIVFSSVSEEWGLLAAVLFVLLILLLLATALINTPRNYYHGTVVVGVTAVFIVQMSLNIFGSCNLIPFTGVTLPFLSAGGTSMVTCGFLIGMFKAAQSPVLVRNIVVKRSEATGRGR